MGSTHRLQHLFFFCLFLGALILVFLMLQSFLAPLVLAFTLSIVFRPLYNRIKSSVKENETIAALLTLLVVILVVLIPVIFIGRILFTEAVNLYTALTAQGGGQVFLNQVITTSQNFLHGFAPHLTVDINEYVRQGLQWFVNNLNAFFSEIFHITFAIIIMIIAFYYILKDGHKLRDQYMRLSPLPDNYDKRIFDVMAMSMESVLKGSFIIAVVQGIMGAIGTTIAGYGNPVLWAIFTAIASFLPGVGTGIVIIPAILFKFFTGQVVSAVILLVWYTIAVASIDNILSPYLIRRGGIGVHPFLILLGILGGIVLFGPIGFILGPLIMAIFFALLEIYPLIIERT